MPARPVYRLVLPMVINNSKVDPPINTDSDLIYVSIGPKKLRRAFFHYLIACALKRWGHVEQSYKGTHHVKQCHVLPFVFLEAVALQVRHLQP